MASKSRRISNNAGSANSFLNAVKTPDKGSTKIDNAIQSAGKDEKLVKSILLVVKQCIDDSGQYQKALDSKSIDVTLGRIATLLDEVKDNFVKNELEDVKKEILDEISGFTTSGVLKSFLLSQISELFNNDATKDDIEDLKQWISENVTGSKTTANAPSFENDEELEKEDNKEGEYQDSTPAKNFSILQNTIVAQIDKLNDNLKNIPGQSGIFSKLRTAIGVGFGATLAAVSKVTKGVANVVKGVAGITKKVATMPFKLIGSGISKLTKGVGSVIKSVAGIGKKVVTAPFKAIGGVFSKLNPFKKRNTSKEDKKQKLKDKMMDVMAKVVGKIWNAIEPFIDKVLAFAGIITKFVIVPIAVIALKVLLIVATITAIAVGLVLAYFQIKKKIAYWTLLFKSGKLWQHFKTKLIQFGKWYLKTLVKVWKFLLIDIPVWIWEKLCDFGEWLWEKLCEFGNWLYDNNIYPYVVEPFKKYIWEPAKKLWNKKIWPKIEPFIQSLTDLKDKIIKAFSAWDTNKSIWENLKNIGGILKNTIVEWWNNSPFKVFYENNIKPFVESAKDLFNRLANLGGFIKDAIMSWWNGDSSLGDTIKNIGTKVWDTIKEWWKTSIFKEYWDKLKNYLDDLLKPLKKWYEKSDLKKWVDKVINFGKAISDGIKEWWKEKIAPKIEQLKQKLSTIIIKVPFFGFVRLFGPAVGMPFKLSESEAEDYEKFGSKIEKLNKAESNVNDEIAELEKRLKNGDYSNEKDSSGVFGKKRKWEIERDLEKLHAQQRALKKQASNLAEQQIQKAAKPIQSIESMQQENNADISKNGEEINKDIMQKEKQQQQFNAQQANDNAELKGMIKDTQKAIANADKNPHVIPMYVPNYSNYYSAMMQTN